MDQYIILYGFTRRKDGLRVLTRGIDRARCFQFHADGECSAIVSFISPSGFEPGLLNMVRHEEVVQKIFSKQVIVPVKFPKVLSLPSLKKSLIELDDEIVRVLQKIIFKAEFHLKVFLLDVASQEAPSMYFNAFSRFILENVNHYRYKHYFPTPTKEAKEAEFLHYAEQVVNHISVAVPALHVLEIQEFLFRKDPIGLRLLGTQTSDRLISQTR